MRSDRPDEFRNGDWSLVDLIEVAGNQRGDVFVLGRAVQVGANFNSDGTAVYKLVHHGGDAWQLKLVLGLGPHAGSPKELPGLTVKLNSRPKALAVSEDGGFIVGGLRSGNSGITDLHRARPMLSYRNAVTDKPNPSPSSPSTDGFLVESSLPTSPSTDGFMVESFSDSLTGLAESLVRQSNGDYVGTVTFYGNRLLRSTDPYTRDLAGGGARSLHDAGNGEEGTEFSLNNDYVPIAPAPDGGVFMVDRTRQNRLFGVQSESRLLYASDSQLDAKEGLAERLEEAKKATYDMQPLSYGIDPKIENTWKSFEKIRQNSAATSTNNKNTPEWWAAFRATLAQQALQRLLAGTVTRFEADEARLRENISYLTHFTIERFYPVREHRGASL
jgi:hypothetical protein